MYQRYLIPTRKLSFTSFPMILIAIDDFILRVIFNKNSNGEKKINKIKSTVVENKRFDWLSLGDFRFDVSRFLRNGAVTVQAWRIGGARINDFRSEERRFFAASETRITNSRF